MLFAGLALLDSTLMSPTTASVHHGRRQKLEIADLELAGFFDENDLQIEVRIKILAFFNSSTVMPCLWATFASSCGDSSVWI